MAATLREYLVSLGAEVDQKSFNKFKAVLVGSAKTVGAFAGALVTATTVIAATAKSLDKTSQNYEEMARKTKKTTEEIRAQETALKILGRTIADIKADKKLQAQYDNLVKLGRIISLPEAQGGVLVLRNMLKTVDELRVVGTYALQWINYHLLNRVKAPLEEIWKGLEKFKTNLRVNMPTWTKRVGDFLGNFMRLASAGVKGITDVIQLIGRLPDRIKQIGVAIGATFTMAKMGPVGWILTGLTAILALLDDFYTYKRGGKSALSEFWQGIEDGTVLQVAVQKIAGFFSTVEESIRTAFNIDEDENLFLGIGEKIAGWVKNGFVNAEEWAKVKLANLLNITSENGNNADSVAWGDIGRKLASWIKDGFTTFSDWGKTKLANLLGITSDGGDEKDNVTWKNIGQKAAKWIKEGFTGFSDWGKTKLADLLGITSEKGENADSVTWGNIGEKIAEWIKNGFSKAENWTRLKMSKLFGLESDGGDETDAVTWGNIGGKIAEWVRNGFSTASEWVKVKLSTLLGITKEDGSSDDVTWTEIGQNVATKITDGFKKSGSFIKKLVLGDEYTDNSTWTDVGNKIWGGIQAAFEGKDIIGVLFGNLSEKLEGIATFAANLLSSITEWLGKPENMKAFADTLGNVIKTLAPVLVDLAVVFGKAIWQAIGTLVPDGDFKRALWGLSPSEGTRSVEVKNGQITVGEGRLGYDLDNPLVAYSGYYDGALFGINMDKFGRDYYTNKYGDEIGFLYDAAVRGESSSVKDDRARGKNLTNDPVAAANALYEKFGQYLDVDDWFSLSGIMNLPAEIEAALANPNYHVMDPKKHNEMSELYFNAGKALKGETTSQYGRSQQELAQHFIDRANAIVDEYNASEGAEVLPRFEFDESSADSFETQFYSFLDTLSGASILVGVRPSFSTSGLQTGSGTISTGTEETSTTPNKQGHGGFFDKPTDVQVGDDGLEAIIPMTNPSRAKALLQQMFARMGSASHDILASLGVPAWSVDHINNNLSELMNPAWMYPSVGGGGVNTNSGNTVTSHTTINVYGSGDPIATGNAAAKASESNIIRRIRGCFE